MDVKKKKPEDFMYDVSDAEWTEESTSGYWKEVEKEVLKKLGKRGIVERVKDYFSKK